MIRVVLAGLKDDDWRVYRQSQWMSAVREQPGLASCPRMHFDVAEPAYQAMLEDWESSGAGSGKDAATTRLAGAHAVEVRRS